MRKRILSILLALCMVLCLVPTVVLAANSSSPTAIKSVGLGTSMLPNPEVPKDVDTAWKGSYVYYGVYNGEPIKFRMLSKRTTDFGGETMLLDCDTALWSGYKGDNPDGNKGIFGTTNVWADSDIREYLNGTFLTKYFSQQEQVGIAPSTKAAPGASDGRGFISYIIWADNTLDYYERALFCPLNGEKIFLMDAKELTNTSYGYFCAESGEMQRSKSIAKAPSGSIYLIRSRYWNGESLPEYVCSIDDGAYDDGRCIDYNLDVSPALNIELSSVLFTTAAESGKVIELDGNVPATRTNRTDSYKLTLLDSSRNFSVNETAKECAHGNAITFTYNNAVVGENEYISAMIVNDKNEVLNYGPLKAVDTATGTVELIIPFNIASGTYALKLFNEHINGDFKTDYASAFADVTLTVNSAIGKDGKDGETPQLKIGSDNFWYVSYDNGSTWTSLGVQASGDKGDKGDTGAQGDKGADGTDGKDGTTPVLKIGTDNLWYVSYDNGTTWTSLGIKATGDTGVSGADGKDGKDGKTPRIGENGNWWIGDIDTGVNATGNKGDKGDKGDTGAQGEKGEKGEKGDDGKDGANGKDGHSGSSGVTPILKIDADNIWCVSYNNGSTWTSLGVKATGEKGDKGDKGDDGAPGVNGKDGKDGKNGKNGIGIVKAEINANGELILYYTNGNVSNLGKIIGEAGKDGLTPSIGDNGNWWIGDTDTGVAAVTSITASSDAIVEKDNVAVLAIAIAGLSLLSNIALILYIILKRKNNLV